jgi:biopolymer transport protein ExbB/TolQ
MSIGVVFIVAFSILFTLIKWGLIIWGIVWLVRYLKATRQEKQRFRLELGKLAEEVRILREELKAQKQ